MKQLLFFFLFISLHMAALSIPNASKPDSLVSVLYSGLPDTAKAEAAYSLSEYYYKHGDPTKAIFYLKKGKELASKYPLWITVAGYYETLIHEQEDHGKAEQSYLTTEQNLQKFTSKDAYYYRAACWYNYGVLQQYKDDQKGFADIVLTKALPLAEKSGAQIFIGKTYWGLGVVFKNILQYPQSENNLKKAIEIFITEKAIDPYLIKAYNTIAETYILEAKYNYADQALAQAYRYLNMVDASKDLWMDYYTSRGMYFTVVKKYDQSVNNLKKGIDIADRSGDTYRKGRLLMQLFYSFYEAKNFEKALETLGQMNRDTLLTVQLTNRLQIYDGYAQTYAQKGDYMNAFEWQTKYSALSDSVNSSKLKSDINAMEVKFHTAEKEKKITLLEAKQKETQLETRNKDTLIFSLLIVCILLLSLVIVAWSSYRKTKNLDRQKELLHQQVLQQKEQDLQLESVRTLLEGEEKERNRIARDLHDGLGGMLASLKFKLSHIATENKWPQNANELSKIADPIDSILQELRRISRNMVPPTLMQFGLEIALNDLCQSYNIQNTTIEFQPITIRKDIYENDQLMIYRIVQELLANAMKHASAKNILIQCSQNGELFLITFEDDGIGFDPKNITSKGIGLANIEHRVNYMDGSIDLSTCPGKGTAYNIELKLNSHG
ncbi:MAG: sensor histidine kinase [Arachidicoccus sp.]|nr:sensor histidine kinase [Arachidicoccus sp.]